MNETDIEIVKQDPESGFRCDGCGVPSAFHIDGWDVFNEVCPACARKLYDGFGRELGDCWQPISTAPKDGLIMVCWAGSGMPPIISRWLKNREVWTTPFNKPVNPPTHWMPLPDAPAIAKAEPTGQEGRGT